MMKKYFLLINMLALAVAGCKPSFSFTGTNINPAIETFTIENFLNDSGEGPSNLAVQFSQSMREYFQRNTRLDPVSQNGHLNFAGSIVRYEVTPAAPGATESQQAELQKLTIEVQFTYENAIEPDKGFQRSVTKELTFPAERSLQEMEPQLIPELFEQVIFDIFNSTLADW
jgi:hypothetical protein